MSDPERNHPEFFLILKVSVTLKSLFVYTFWCPSLPHGVPVTWAQSPKFSSRKVANVCLSIAIHLTIDSLLSLTSSCFLYFFNVYTVFFGPSKGSHKLVLLLSQWIVEDYIPHYLLDMAYMRCWSPM